MFLRTSLAGLTAVALSLGGAAVSTAAPVQSPEKAGLASVGYLPVNTSEAPRYAEPVSLTNNGLVYVSSEGAATAALKIWYSDGVEEYAFAPYVHGSELSSAVGTGISVADLGDGTDQAIWLTYDSNGNSQIMRAVLGSDFTTETLVNGAVEGEWPESAVFLGATKDTLWWATYSGDTYSLATSSLLTPTNLTLDVTFLGEGIDQVKFDAERAVIQYTSLSAPITGKYTRIAVFPNQPASSYPTDANVISTVREAYLIHGMQLTPEALTWLAASDIPGVPSTLALYRFSEAKLSALATNAQPSTIFTSYLSDVTGQTKGWYLIQESAGNGFLPRGDGPIRGISLDTGTSTTFSSRGFGAMPALAGRFVYYSLTSLGNPKMLVQYSDSSNMEIASVERRPRTVDAIAIAGDTLVASEQIREDGIHRLIQHTFDPSQPDLLPGPSTRIRGVQPTVPEDVRDRNEALLASRDGIYTLGYTEAVSETPIDGVVAIDMGNTVWWANSLEGRPTALRGISLQRLLTRTINDATNTLRTWSPVNGESLGALPDVVAEATSGPNLYTVASNSVGLVNRLNTLTGETSSFVLESGCTPFVQAAAGAYLLYECAGTAKVALLGTDRDGGILVTTAVLPNGYTWALGDGFLGYRSIPASRDIFSVDFGWVELGDLSNISLQYLDSATLYNTPVFAVDATGGQRMVWSKGMTMGIARFDVEPSGPAPSSPVSASPGLSPNGDGKAETWSATAVYESALDWRLTISNSRGAEVYSSSGTAADGNVDATWDGRSRPGGPILSDGEYSWSLSLSLPFGSNMSVTSGVLALRTQGADPQIKPNLGAFGPSASFSWVGDRPMGVSGWDVSYRTAVMGATGTTTFGPWVTLLTDSVSTKATAGSASKPLTRGTSIQVRVLPVDALGLPGRNTTSTIPVAFDDTNFTFGSGWSKRKFASAYFGTLASTTRKATATRAFNGAGFSLYGQKAAKHGVFEVWIDGKKSATVNTYAKKTVNKALLWKSPKLKAGKHTVQIRALATKGRPTVVLDAMTVQY